MGSDHPTQSKLHVVELNEMNSTAGTSLWESTSDSVRVAMETYGCVVVSCEKARAQAEAHDGVFDLMEEAFRLPLETKVKLKGELLGFGYEGDYPLMPLFQSFGIGDGATLQVVKDFTTLMWPHHGHDKFCETIHSYSQLLNELGRTVMRMVLTSYGLEKHYDNLVDSSLYNTRLIKYRPPTQGEGDLGLQPHKDKNFHAVVGTNQVKGLQIETPDGEWVDFEPAPDRFIVLAGEILTAWTNGRIYSPLHRVVSRGSGEKYSVGYFTFIRGTLHVPEELVDDENPLKFKPFDNMEFMEYCKQLGHVTVQSAIQTYCGI